ncbi:MAG: C-GCAxxG-C-C family protein [Endomicrobiaceae bacterium]|nr:C-GCAxxG-C-C family protein [Endomicrobiaceae bacterium]
MGKSQEAEKLFKDGYNCCQSVICAFSKDLNIDFDTALKISSSFGGGMGRLREVCGAVSAMFMVAGLKYGYIDPKDHKAKAEHYKLIQELAKQFEEKYGSIVCRQLLGLEQKKDNPNPSERTESYYKKRPCSEFVSFSAELMEKMIESKKT